MANLQWLTNARHHLFNTARGPHMIDGFGPGPGPGHHGHGHHGLGHGHGPSPELLRRAVVDAIDDGSIGRLPPRLRHGISPVNVLADGLRQVAGWTGTLASATLDKIGNLVGAGSPDAKTIGTKSPAPVETRDLKGEEAKAPAVTAPAAVASPVAAVGTKNLFVGPFGGLGAVDRASAAPATEAAPPAIETYVSVRSDFVRAADPTVKLSASPTLDSLIEQANKGSDPERLKTLNFARAQITGPAP